MKNIISVLLLAIPLSLFSQQVHEQIIKSEIKKVKLFLTSGEILQEQSIKLNKGRNKVIFSGISTFADPQSIQFNSDGEFKLVSISTEMDFLAAEQLNPRISSMKDSLENLNEQLKTNENNRKSYDAELSVLNTNRDLKGDNQNLTVAQIKEAAEYYRVRTFEINQKLTQLIKEQRKTSNRIEKLKKQLIEINYDENKRSNQVIILIDVNNNTTLNSTLKYLVSDCGWAATYDLSAIDLNQKINLKYKAKIYNNTGNEWKNIDLILSTGDPRLTASSPDLNPWYLNNQELREVLVKRNKNEYKSEEVNFQNDAIQEITIANQRVYDNYVVNDGETIDDFDKKPDSKKRQDINKNGVIIRQIEISELSTEFIIATKINCPSDSKPYVVDIKEMNLDATFSHVSVPKLDNGTFLQAQITGWQEFDLIPGPTNVYFGGQYVGQSEIDTKNIEDTLSLSFGRDNKVQTVRKLKSELSTKKVIGNTKKDSYLYEISIRNNRTSPITVDLFDQIPVSKSSEIIVSVDETTKANYNEITGETSWKIILNPGEIKTVELGYTVKYPKNIFINVNTFRTISCPSF